jgi:hypothetical protein
MKNPASFETYLKQRLRQAEASEKKTLKEEKALIDEGIQDDEVIYETYMIGREIDILNHMFNVFLEYKEKNKLVKQKRITAIQKLVRQIVWVNETKEAKNASSHKEGNMAKTVSDRVKNGVKIALERLEKGDSVRDASSAGGISPASLYGNATKRELAAAQRKGAEVRSKQFEAADSNVVSMPKKETTNSLAVNKVEQTRQRIAELKAQIAKEERNLIDVIMGGE